MGFDLDARQSSLSYVPQYVPDLAQKILSWLILVGGLATVPAAAYLSWISDTDVPYGDMWDLVREYVTTHGHPPVGWLIAQHNEHRILILKLLFLADVDLFHGREWLFFGSMFVAQFALLGGLAWLLWHWGGFRGSLWRASIGLAAFCLFCPSQWENFCWDFQVSFFLPGCFALLVFLLVLRCRRPCLPLTEQWSYVILGVAVAFIATFSNANGMLIWPLAIGMVALLRLPFKIVGAYAFFGICASALYFHHYHTPSQTARPFQSLQHPLAVAEYMAKYFGSSFPWKNVSYSVPVGWEALALAVALIAWAIARGVIREPLPLVLEGLMLFCLMTAFVTALGRLSFGTGQAVASRYQTWALLFWFSLATLLLLALVRAGARVSITCFMTGLVAVMIIAAANFYSPLHFVKYRRTKMSIAAVALMTRVPDYKVISGIFPLPQRAFEDSAYLRDRGLFIFSTGLYRELDRPLSDVHHLLPKGSCEGYVDIIHLAPEERPGWVGLKIAGWAVSTQSRWPAKRIVAAADGKIVGFGVVGSQRRDVVVALHAPGALLSGWTGFARVPAGTASLQILAQMRGRGVCEVASVAIPAQ